MRKIVLFTFFLSLAFGGEIRHFFDNVGYCTRPAQIEAVVKAATLAEKNLLKKEKSKGFFAVICPHDDHMYAGRVYVHAIPKIAHAKTIIAPEDNFSICNVKIGVLNNMNKTSAG